MLQRKWLTLCPHAALFGILFSIASTCVSATGQLLWQDNFDTLDSNHWSVVSGDGCSQGICGWGNNELQWYGESNVYIAEVPGESGNLALVLEARDDDINGYAFSSGRVESQHKLALQYGMIETRIRVPNVDMGLWPAAWLLGTSTANWPAKGEIDMMEMGHSYAQRSAAGFPKALSNHYVGANLIFHAQEACTADNPSCAASAAWQTDNAYVSTQPLNDRFVIYRTYWKEQSIRFTVEDNGVEYDLYEAPFAIGDNSEEFRNPFYLLLNLAVGGNFTDATSIGQVSAARPARLYIDYIRVYTLDGQGQVIDSNDSSPETGVFGVFTDTATTDNQLQAGVDADIYNWNTASVIAGTQPAYEGNNVIAWRYISTNEWFGGSVQTRQPKDMSLFVDGYLTFQIAIPPEIGFKIGIADTYTNEHWISIPPFDNRYGERREGWSQIRIPIEDLRGSLIALQSLKTHFMIASLDAQLPQRAFDIALDNIVWSGGKKAENNDDQTTTQPADPADPNNTEPNNNSQIPTAYTGYTGVYDDFSLLIDERFTAFNSTWWEKGDGAVGTEGDCRFQDQGVDIHDGVLALTIRKETVPASYSYDHSAEKKAYDFSCGELRTANKYRYGRIEARFRTPSTPSTGFISSLFTYDVENYEWRELDIELEGGRPNTMQSNYIFGNNADTWNYEWQATRTWGAWERLHNSPHSTQDWIVYAIEWTPDYVAWFMDGVEYRRLSNQDLDGNPLVPPQIASAWLPENHTKIMMNFWIPTRSVGVNFGGDPIGNQYPMHAEYDWFRYYAYTPGQSDNATSSSSLSSTSSPTSSSSSSSSSMPSQVDPDPIELRALDNGVIEFTVANVHWADLHYTLNEGVQQNIRMSQNGFKATFQLTDLDDQDTISYFVTYHPIEQSVTDSDWNTVTFDGNASPADETPQSQNCSTSYENAYGVSQQSANGTAEFFVDNAVWADIHYTVNNHVQLNVRMTHIGNNNIYLLPSLQQGDSVRYWFTHETNNLAADTPTQTMTFGDCQ